MKKTLQITLILTLILGLISVPGAITPKVKFVQAAALQQDPEPTATMEPPVSQVAVRPLLYIVDYSTGSDGKKSVSPYGEFTLNFVVGNNGKNDPATNRTAHARNIVMTFNSTTFYPLDGSVKTLWEVDADNQGNETVSHRFKVNEMESWYYTGIITAQATYSDDQGMSYSDTFTFTITINQQPGSGTTAATATPTVKPVNRPQMIINSYETDVIPLQPGSNFKLKMSVTNAGNADARAVSVVFGGGVSSVPNPEGTPEPHGIGGGTGDTSNFAPVGNSNVVLLGDMVQGATMTPEQSFIVNVSATPGAYPFKISFVYSDPAGHRLVDDAVITLLVHRLPQLQVSFYRPVEGSFFMNSGGSLPIQITNLGKNAVVLGNAIATTTQGMVTDNTLFLGSIDPGSYQTFDPQFTPSQPGEATIDVAINYTDDFNQIQTYKTQLTVNVEEAMPTPEPFPKLDDQGNPVIGEDGKPVMVDPMNPFPDPGMETPQKTSFFNTLWNALKSFFGITTAPSGGNMEQPPSFNEGGGGMFIGG